MSVIPFVQGQTIYFNPASDANKAALAAQAQAAQAETQAPAPTQVKVESGYKYGNWTSSDGSTWVNRRTGEKVQNDPYSFKNNPQTETFGNAPVYEKKSYSGSLSTGQANNMPAGTQVVERGIREAVASGEIRGSAAVNAPVVAPVGREASIAAEVKYTQGQQFVSQLERDLGQKYQQIDINKLSGETQNKLVEFGFATRSQPTQPTQSQGDTSFLYPKNTYSDIGKTKNIPSETPFIAGLVAEARANMKGGTFTLPQRFVEETILHQYENKNETPFQGLALAIGINTGKTFDVLASKSQYLAGKDIIRIPSSLVGGEKDWVWRVPTQKEADTAFRSEKASAILELKQMANREDTSAFGLVPLTGEAAGMYRALKYSASSTPAEIGYTYVGGRLLGAAIPTAGALSRIGAQKYATQLATAEGGIGLGMAKTISKNIITPAVNNAEALMNIGGGLYIAGKVEEAGQAPGGLTIGTSLVEGAKLGIAYKGFSETYNPTLKSLRGVETVSELAKTTKPMSVLESEIAGKTKGFQPSAPPEPSGKSLYNIEKEIGGQSRFTGEAPSNFNPSPSRFGFSDVGSKFKIIDVTPKTGSPRTSEYGYGNPIKNIGNPFEGFGEIGSTVGKTVVGFGKGIAERGELPVPDFSLGGAEKTYQGSEIIVGENTFVHPSEFPTPKIDKFGGLTGNMNKSEVGIGTGTYTGSEFGNKFINDLVNPTINKNINENINPNENPNVNENRNVDEYVYETRYTPATGYEAFGIFPPWREGGGGGGGMRGFSFERKRNKTRINAIVEGDPFKGAFDLGFSAKSTTPARRTRPKPTKPQGFDLGFKGARNPIGRTLRKTQGERKTVKGIKPKPKPQEFDLGLSEFTENPMGKSKSKKSKPFWE